MCGMPETAQTGGGPEAEALLPEPVRSSRRHGRSLVSMAIEVALIGLGVFLGLAGEQWRQNRQYHADALESLQRFRAEIVANRTELSTKLAYHAPLQKGVAAFLAADAKGRDAISLKFSGLQPPSFERTAWDLAIATQSLTHIDPDVAFERSRVEAFLNIVDLYYSDLMRWNLHSSSNTTTSSR